MSEENIESAMRHEAYSKYLHEQALRLNRYCGGNPYTPEGRRSEELSRRAAYQQYLADKDFYG